MEFHCLSCGTAFECRPAPKFCIDCGKELPAPAPSDVNGDFLLAIERYLQAKDLLHTGALERRMDQRQAGKSFSTEEHIAGLIYAQLSNQTVWSRIEPHLPQIDALFFHYDPQKLLTVSPEALSGGIFALKCGNISTKAQMRALHFNIAVFAAIAKEFGSLDAFVTSAPAHIIVQQLSSARSPWKLHQLGPALAWEYLRNVGIDGAKPDTHLRRFLGADRMPECPNPIATPEEAISQVERLSAATGRKRVVIDNLIWSYCADGYGAVCTAVPHCGRCVIREQCHRNK